MTTQQAAFMAPQADVRPDTPPLLSDQVTVDQQVYDTRGAHVGRVAARSPLSLIEQVKGQSLWLNVSEDSARVPMEINGVPASPASEDRIDISDVSSRCASPLTSAQTCYYHNGPRSPGINTNASGLCTPAEIDPRGRLRDRPGRLYITGNQLHSCNGNRECFLYLKVRPLTSAFLLRICTTFCLFIEAIKPGGNPPQGRQSASYAMAHISKKKWPKVRTQGSASGTKDKPA